MSIFIARSPYRLQSRMALRPRRRHSVAVSRNGASGRAGVAESMASSVAGSVKRIREATMKLEFGPSMAIGGLLMIAVLFMLLYLAHFNQVATKGYDLRRLEADRQQLLNQYDIKNMKLAEAKSLTTIIGSDKITGMRRPNEITYVRGNTALASR